MELYKKLLDNNKKWVDSMLAQDSEYFSKLAGGQKPPLLWIGCADSRVPANEIIGAAPGEVFVHRNIANMVVHTDMNMLSVLDYAVNVLKVQHVIVCGHYGCGGVKAAMSNQQFGLIDNWIRHIKDVYRFHQDELEAITDPVAKENRFICFRYNAGLNKILEKYLFLFITGKRIRRFYQIRMLSQFCFSYGFFETLLKIVSKPVF